MGRKRAAGAAKGRAKKKKGQEKKQHPLDRAFGELEPVLDAPEAFYAPDAARAEKLKALAKTLYDAGEGVGVDVGGFARLLVDGFDAEQIWEELEMRNEPLRAHVEAELPSFEAASDEASSEEDEASEEEVSEGDEEAEDDDAELQSEGDSSAEEDEAEEAEAADSESGSDDDEDDEDDEDEDENGGTAEVVEDHFFSLEDMEKFADLPFDDEDEDEDEEDSDESDEDGEGGKKAMYSDFFAPPKAKKKGGAEEGDAEFEEETVDLADEPMSRYEKSQKAMKERIAALEEQIVQPREWDQTGEVDASQRPADSLLERAVEFDFVGKLPPPVTQEVTASVEDIIRKRIADNVFDDVERKVEIKERAFRPRQELSQEKSQMGLAEVYEREYVAKVVGEAEDQQLSDELTKQHREVAILFSSLCHKLDALSNFHFTPKAPREELEVQSSAPAIQMEEVLPTGVSTSLTTAPQDVFRSRAQGAPVGRREMDTDEKQRRRRAKRARRRTKGRAAAVEEKEQARVDPKVAARLHDKQLAAALKSGQQIKRDTAVSADATRYNNSTSFFARVQEQVDAAKDPRRQAVADRKRKRAEAEAAPATGSKYML